MPYWLPTAPPYHPEFLRTIPAYRVLYSGDDPDSTYRRNIPYLHAYHHVFFADPVYSPDLDMEAKMRSCGMVNADWLPLGVFDFEFVGTATDGNGTPKGRDLDVIYVGGIFPQKLDLLAKLRREIGRRFKMRGLFRIKHNVYFVVRFGYRGWVRPVSYPGRVSLYQRSKIGVNIHWNDFGLGNQRLYHLPANGVLQISDCAPFLGRVFEVGREVVPYGNAGELIERIRYYLSREEERRTIAQRGYERTMRDYRFREVTLRAGRLIAEGMRRIDWKRAENDGG